MFILQRTVKKNNLCLVQNELFWTWKPADIQKMHKFKTHWMKEQLELMYKETNETQI